VGLRAIHVSIRDRRKRPPALTGFTRHFDYGSDFSDEEESEGMSYSGPDGAGAGAGKRRKKKMFFRLLVSNYVVVSHLLFWLGTQSGIADDSANASETRLRLTYADSMEEVDISESEMAYELGDVLGRIPGGPCAPVDMVLFAEDVSAPPLIRALDDEDAMELGGEAIARPDGFMMNQDDDYTDARSLVVSDDEDDHRGRPNEESSVRMLGLLPNSNSASTYGPFLPPTLPTGTASRGDDDDDADEGVGVAPIGGFGIGYTNHRVRLLFSFYCYFVLWLADGRLSFVFSHFPSFCSFFFPRENRASPRHPRFRRTTAPRSSQPHRPRRLRAGERPD
jgi:hypothetical protein